MSQSMDLVARPLSDSFHDRPCTELHPCETKSSIIHSALRTRRLVGGASRGKSSKTLRATAIAWAWTGGRIREEFEIRLVSATNLADAH